jgi:hypothetical protein
MKQCGAIKPKGGRCERIVANDTQYCYAHDPARQAERKRNAARGGKAKASSAGEVGQVKSNLQALADAVLDGEVDTRVAAVATQIWNAYLSAVRTELQVRDQEELVGRLEALEGALAENERRRHGS